MFWKWHSACTRRFISFHAIFLSSSIQFHWLKIFEMLKKHFKEPTDHYIFWPCNVIIKIIFFDEKKNNDENWKYNNHFQFERNFPLMCRWDEVRFVSIHFTRQLKDRTRRRAKTVGSWMVVERKGFMVFSVFRLFICDKKDPFPLHLILFAMRKYFCLSFVSVHCSFCWFLSWNEEREKIFRMKV